MNISIKSGFGAVSPVREKTNDKNSLTLIHRSPADPMRLINRIMSQLDQYFMIHQATYLSGQRELLKMQAEAILTAIFGSVTAVPLVPGAGKSTLIRSILAVLSEEFCHDTPIAQAIGGIIVIVEKTAEAYELEKLCNEFKPDTPVAFVIQSPNDYNLALGLCANGSAIKYEDCLRHACPDYLTCPLMQSSGGASKTPILIMLHARYRRHMEDMTYFLSWFDSKQEERQRTLLLIDELPPLIEENEINLGFLNQLETQISTMRPSYQQEMSQKKHSLLFDWSKSIRTPFFRLLTIIRQQYGYYGIISKDNLQESGFDVDSLACLLKKIEDYAPAPDSKPQALLESLIKAQRFYYSVGQDISLFLPRLVRLEGKTQPATFIFSGTASLSPELSDNPYITVLQGEMDESYSRLNIRIQRGDVFESSKTAFHSPANRAGLVEWLKCTLSNLRGSHERILVVTYQSYAKEFWEQLRDFHDLLMPYIDSDGNPQPKLPYFGGLNGSNLYQSSTCVISFGLNRFEPKDYISRALALDFSGSHVKELQNRCEEGSRLDQLNCVMQMQDITLARDIVQLAFRSKLRQHGDSAPIELWLLQPPNGVVDHLVSYFSDCQVQEIADLPASCKTAVASARIYKGEPTHAAKLLKYLNNWNGEPINAKSMQELAGLSRKQYKEARKHPEVRQFFNANIITAGSGKNTVFRRVGDNPDRSAA